MPPWRLVQPTKTATAPCDVTVFLLFFSTQVRNSLGLSEDMGEDEEEGLEDAGGGRANSSLARLWGKTLKKRGRSYTKAELASLWSLLQQEEYTFLRCGHRYSDWELKLVCLTSSPCCLL